MLNKKDGAQVYDIRTVDFSMAKGKLKPSDYEKHLKSLPNDEDNYDFVQIENDEAENEAFEE